MPYFPLFVDLTGKRVLIVGGGHVALRKLKKLLPYGANIVVVAPELLPEIVQIPNLMLHTRKFLPTDLQPRPALVIAATNDMKVNGEISRLCQAQNIPVNVVDAPDACSFLFPALVQQGNFSAGISTGGASPTAASYFKEQLQALLPAQLDSILDYLEEQRARLKNQLISPAQRAGILRELLDACIAKGAPLNLEETDARCTRSGCVTLVGAGCGKADLITVRGLRALQQCQAVVYDDLIDPALPDAAPESALRIYMGKRSGHHAAAQAEINQKLIELAQSGLRVVRLKGGDPYLFGRGGEEMLALQAAGIPCTEIPGIPSAIGIPAEAGIPVTHRGQSQALHIITAHTADTPDGLPANFDTLAKLPGTLVFLMGLRQLPEIVSRLLAAGMPGDTPAAVLSGGNTQNPAQIRAPLYRLAEAAKEVLPPAIILVGSVAAMDVGAAPLAGLHIGITGTKAVAAKQQQLLQALGAKTHWISRTTARPLPFSLPQPPCWLVFTSANGVHTFFQQFPDAAHCTGYHFAVIGAATAKTLQAYCVAASVCPEVFTGEALAKALIKTVAKDEKINLLRSSIGTALLPELLRRAGCTVQDIPIYELHAIGALSPLPHLDYLTFSSGSGVDFFFQQYGNLPTGVRCVCIGNSTASSLSAHTTAPCLISPAATVTDMVQTILNDHHK